MVNSDYLYTMIGDKNREKVFASEHIDLSPSDINPVGYGGVKIDVLGYTIMKIQFKDREIVGKVYVAKSGVNLLGWRHRGTWVLH